MLSIGRNTVLDCRREFQGGGGGRQLYMEVCSQHGGIWVLFGPIGNGKVNTYIMGMFYRDRHHYERLSGHHL